MFAWRDNYISYNGGGGSANDPYWTSVSYLTNFEQPASAFIDSSNYDFPPTVAGTVLPNATSPFNGVGGSANFNGSSTWLVFPYNNPASVLGTNDFTMECWVYCTNNSGYGEMMAINLSGGSYAAARVVHVSGTIYFLCSSSPGNWINTTSVGGAVTTGSWIHFAAVRYGNNFNLYKNGTSIISYSSSASLYNASGQSTVAGMLNQSFTGSFIGFFSNVRFVNGTAVYTSNFTPPTSPLTNIANTTLLLNFTNQGQYGMSLIDQSLNMFTLTPSSSSPTNSGASPFGNNYPGSVNFVSASSQNLTVASNAAFASLTTIECWVYFTTLTGATQGIVSGAGSVAFSLILTSSNKFNYTSTGTSGVNITGTTTVSAGVWYSVSVNIGPSNVRLYVNGTQEASQTLYSLITAGALTIGGTTGGYLNGKISNLRLSKGSVRYTTNYTPSTTPLTSDTYTSLLISGNTPGIQDVSTFGQISPYGTGGNLTSANYKFGKQSGYYSGTSTSVNDATSLQFGTGNFTIEGWVYLPTTTSQNIMAKGSAGWQIQTDGSSHIQFAVNGTAIMTSTATVSANTWTYFAVSRSGTTAYLFVNGTLQTSTSNSTNFNQTDVLRIGSGSGLGGAMTGYLDSIRLTKGICRYTATFSAPTSSFPKS